MGAMDHEVMATLLLSVFWFVLIVGVFLVFLVVHWKSRRTAASVLKSEETQALTGSPLNLRHSTLKRPNCWLAIKSKNLLTVQYALSLHNPKPCSWAEGLSGEGEQKIFVSPP